MPPTPARPAPVRHEEILVRPGLEPAGSNPAPCASQAAFSAAWKCAVSSAYSMQGFRSAPPPNHQAPGVQNIRVFMCTAGACGFCICATRLMPEAQNRGSSLDPGHAARGHRLLRRVAQRAVHGRDVDPDLLEHPAAAHHAHQPAAGVRAVIGGALRLGHLEPACRHGTRRAAAPGPLPAPRTPPTISSRSWRNQALARVFCSVMAASVIGVLRWSAFG